MKYFVKIRLVKNQNRVTFSLLNSAGVTIDVRRVKIKKLNIDIIHNDLLNYFSYDYKNVFNKPDNKFYYEVYLNKDMKLFSNKYFAIKEVLNYITEVYNGKA